MRMPPVKRVTRARAVTWGDLFGDVDQRLPSEVSQEISESERSKWGLDDIAMAPICAHDCFHMHWRWSDFARATDLPNLGWDAHRPYQLAGWPLVPRNQHVFLRNPTPATLYYQADAGPEVAAGQWTIINHHGAAYLLAAGSALETPGAPRT